MAIVYMGIGSNIGDKEANFKKALEYLQGAKDIKLLEQSGFYVTRPLAGAPQEDYLNGVLKIHTEITPWDLLAALKNIEQRMGRTISEFRNCPRIIDLDILLYGSMVMATRELTIPHPRLSERQFVLRGLCQIAPNLLHPVLGKTMGELYDELQGRLRGIAPTYFH